MKIFKIILTIIFLSAFMPINANCEEELTPIQLEMRGYDEITLSEGTFIPVINIQEISTESCPEGYKVSFIATNDLYLKETNIIPRDTTFYGYIEKINEPIVGTNASMKIKVTKLITPDGFEMPVKAYIYSSNNNLIGGELTEPARLTKMPHYNTNFQRIAWNYRYPTLQLRPAGVRAHGRHTKINAGERLIIILTAPLGVTHTMTE